MTYRRSATHWRSTIDTARRVVQYIVSDEVGIPPCALVSTYDPTSQIPAKRMVRDIVRELHGLTVDHRQTGWSAEPIHLDDDPTPPDGLIVWGRSKQDRPDLHEARALDPVATAAIERAMKRQPGPSASD